MIKQTYICDVCNTTSPNKEDLATHINLPIVSYGFNGGEIISYGDNSGSGINIAIILEPTEIDKDHTQRYSTLGFSVLFSPDQVRHHWKMSTYGFPPLSLKELARNKLEPIVPNPIESKPSKLVTEISNEQFLRINEMLTRKVNPEKNPLRGFLEKAFCSTPDDNWFRQEHSALDVIGYFYPQIQNLSIGRLKANNCLIYEGS